MNRGVTYDRTGTPLQIGALNKCLARQYRTKWGVLSLEQYIERRVSEGEINGKRVSDNMADYSRARFNRMNGKEQAVYMARLQKVNCYMLTGPDGLAFDVPKRVYDAIIFEGAQS